MRDETVKTGIYTGEVVHRRFAPKPHSLAYKIFQVLLDLDNLDRDLKRVRLFSHNRFNLFSFYDRDHGPVQAESGEGSLKDRMIALLRPNGLYAAGDRLFLLAMPRVLGFVFNPISLYFVEGPEGRMKAVVYEVNNTFGDRHSYVLPVHGTGLGDSAAQLGRVRQHSEKRLHVSPFMDMNMAYDFDLTAPEDTFQLNIVVKQTQPDRSLKKMLFAGLSAQYGALRDSTLLRLFFVMPLMTLGVVAGIHWEALLLLLKGVRLRPKPATKRSQISVETRS